MFHNHIHLLLFTSLLFECSKLISQTYVGGNITENTSWSSSGNPYIATGNIQVMLNVTLSISAGVIVKFSNTQVTCLMAI